jgi:hypothetical protein
MASKQNGTTEVEEGKNENPLTSRPRTPTQH